MTLHARESATVGAHSLGHKIVRSNSNHQILRISIDHESLYNLAPQTIAKTSFKVSCCQEAFGSELGVS
jgi:hypothetical protein